MRWRVALILVLAAAFAPRALAHEVRPAYLELRQTGAETFDVLWKVPALGDRRLGLYVGLPGSVRVVGEPRGVGLVAVAARLGASLHAKRRPLAQRLSPGLELLPAYAIGGVAMYWVIERIAGF